MTFSGPGFPCSFLPSSSSSASSTSGRFCCGSFLPSSIFIVCFHFVSLLRFVWGFCLSVFLLSWLVFHGYSFSVASLSWCGPLAWSISLPVFSLLFSSLSGCSGVWLRLLFVSRFLLCPSVSSGGRWVHIFFLCFLTRLLSFRAFRLLSPAGFFCLSICLLPGFMLYVCLSLFLLSFRLFHSRFSASPPFLVFCFVFVDFSFRLLLHWATAIFASLCVPTAFVSFCLVFCGRVFFSFLLCSLVSLPMFRFLALWLLVHESLSCFTFLSVLPCFQEFLALFLFLQ